MHKERIGMERGACQHSTDTRERGTHSVSLMIPYLPHWCPMAESAPFFFFCNATLVRVRVRVRVSGVRVGVSAWKRRVIAKDEGDGHVKTRSR